jgi:uncharacterized membrane protein YecN with MAPEG domain
MALNVVPYYAAVLGASFLALSVNVIRGRRRYEVALGSGGVSDLERGIRVHGNFVEYAPFTLLLLGLAELRGLWPIALHVLCVCLAAGRLLHAWGVSKSVENFTFRAPGFTALGGAALSIIFA